MQLKGGIELKMAMSSKEMSILFTLIALLLSFGRFDPVETVDCSMGSGSCESCHAAHPFCYWCDSHEQGNQCLRYYDDNFAKLECPSGYKFHTCAESSEKARLDKMLGLLLELKRKKYNSFGSESVDGYDGYTDHDPSQSSSVLGNYLNQGARSARAQRIMKLLKLLRVIQNKYKSPPQPPKGVSSNTKGSEEAEQHSSFSNNRGNNYAELPEAHTNSKMFKSTKSASNSDLDALLRLVEKVSTTVLPITAQLSTHRKVVDKNVLRGKLDKLIKGGIRNTSNSLDHITKILTTQKPAILGHKTLSRPIIDADLVSVTSNNTNQKTRELIVKSSNKTSKNRPNNVRAKYCVVFEEEEDCNSDKNCSWCNILSECIGRTPNDFQYCFENNKVSTEKHYSVDPCLERSVCSKCTNGGKCYWCDKTKSCHTYPFFGFVPHNCPANQWYYKECDVQLAIFIILFPLIIILLALVVFYFCLRYCYYRRRILKVPLFEKTGLYEKKQGKKVYFMGADEEDEEIRSEQIRKKYKLPAEKEPLIAP